MENTTQEINAYDYLQAFIDKATKQGLFDTAKDAAITQHCFNVIRMENNEHAEQIKKLSEPKD